jgi:hypothetical protein
VAQVLRPEAALGEQDRPGSAMLVCCRTVSVREHGGTDMRLGSGIFLLVVGAILAFAVQDRWSAVNLSVIGWIGMAAGVLTIVLSLVINQQRQNTSHRENTNKTPPPPPVI